jgi:RNA polymerase sigma-70 factor (ECF subfamily)
MMLNNSEIENIINEFQRLFIQRAYSITGNLEDARDIVQDSLVKYIKFRKSGNEVKSPKSWIMMVIRNGAIDTKRKQQNKNKLVNESIEYERQLSITPKASVSPDRKMEQHEDKALGEGLLNQLNEREKSIVKMKIYDGLSYKDIALKHKMSVSNVGVTIHNAIKKMRKSFLNKRVNQNE